MERNNQLTPTPAASFSLMNFVTSVRQKLDALVLAPNSFTACVCQTIVISLFMSIVSASERST